jgi:hypothetical protein
MIVTAFREPGFASPVVSVVDGPSDVITPATVFHSCRAIRVLLAQTWGAKRWFCPGVGSVSSVDGGGSSYYDAVSHTHLLRWKPADLPPRQRWPAGKTPVAPAALV